jgi:hypothetical protein
MPTKSKKLQARVPVAIGKKYSDLPPKTSAMELATLAARMLPHLQSRKEWDLQARVFSAVHAAGKLLTASHAATRATSHWFDGLSEWLTTESREVRHLVFIGQDVAKWFSRVDLPRRYPIGFARAFRSIAYAKSPGHLDHPARMQDERNQFETWMKEQGAELPAKITTIEGFLALVRTFGKYSTATRSTG